MGGFFQYGVALVANNSSTGCGQGGVSFSGSVIMLGGDVAYHIMPSAFFDPWIGAGLGYEVANVSLSEGSASASAGISGFQFLNLQAGGDFKVMPNFGIGPFVMLSLDEYSNCSDTGAGSSTCTIQSKALHEWLTIGVRGAYDINL